MPNVAKLLQTLHKAVDAFRTTAGRRGRFLQLTIVSDVLVAGDLHGDVDNFKRILDIADLNNHRKRHLVLQELVHGLFRYPTTGGDQSHRLLDLLAALKCQFPGRIHCLLGNHELAQWMNQAIAKNEENLNDLFQLGVSTAYADHAEEIYQAYCQLFAVLAVAIRTPNRVFLSHSLPTRKRLPAWELAKVQEETAAMEALTLGGAIHSVVWGRDLDQQTVELYLNKVDADWLVSGHIPSDEGFLVPNDRQLILDSTGPNGCCCLITTERPVTHKELIDGIIRLHTR